jgi:ribose transport system substrate-binding protein
MAAVKRSTFVVVALLAALTLAGCGGGDDEGSGKTATQTQETVAAGESGRMLGPNGEESTPAADVELTDEDIDKIKQGNYTAAVVWHEYGTDFPRALTRGLREGLKELNIDLISVTSAEFDAAKQANNVESVLGRHPDVIFSIPIDPVTSAPAFRKAREQGTKLVFLSNVPKGFKHGKDYVGIVSSDQISTGNNAAKVMGEALDGKGKIGVIFHDADFFITNQRDNAFRAALKRDYPDIEIAAQSGFDDPARVESIASAMITRNPDLDGIYTTWAAPAEGALAAIREAGRDDIKLVTVDLSEPLAVDMANDGPTAGMASDKVFEAGKVWAKVAGLGLLGKQGPAFAVVDTIAVTKDNLLDAWEESYGASAPKAVQEAMGE